MRLAHALLAGLLACAPLLAAQDTRPPPTGGIVLARPKTETASALGLSSTLLPGETLDLVTCEAVLDGERDFGLYNVLPDPAGWKVADGTWSYASKLENGVEVRFQARPDGDAVALEYTLVNGSKEDLRRAHLHPCLPTVGAPTFYPGSEAQAQAGGGGRAARVGKKDYSELYERLYLWSKDKPFTFASSREKGELHLAFMRRNADPIAWSWWKNAPETFDLPLIAAASKDGKHTLALGFERALWASSNAGDPRACIHLFPDFGKVEKGARATVKGRLYLVAGTPADVRARFLADFPAAGRH